MFHQAPYVDLYVGMCSYTGFPDLHTASLPEGCLAWAVYRWPRGRRAGPRAFCVLRTAKRRVRAVGSPWTAVNSCSEKRLTPTARRLRYRSGRRAALCPASPRSARLSAASSGEGRVPRAGFSAHTMAAVSAEAPDTGRAHRGR